ncbi:MAG: DUF1648 domain-containing protein [Reichenbachiella sp.]
MMNFDNPKLKIELDRNDLILELLGWGTVILCFCLPIFYYADLPENVASHFDMSGNVDGYSGRWMLFFMPCVNLAVYGLLFYLHQVPHLHNYHDEITIENAQGYYTISTKFIRYINVITALLLLYIEYQMVMAALTNESLFNTWSIGLYMILVTLGVVWYFMENRQLKKN